MAVKLGKFFEKTFKKAGLDPAQEVLKPLLDLEEEMPDEIAATLEKNLLNIEEAKKHSDVNKALRQSILGAADTKMDDLIKEMKLQPGDDYVQEKNTYEKIGMLSKLIFDAGQKKATADNTAGVHETLKKEKEAFAQKEQEYAKQVQDFQAKLKQAQDQYEAQEKNYNETLSRNSINYDLYKKLLGKNYALPEKMDTDLKVETALVAINKDLSKRGLSIKRGEDQSLSLFDKDGAPGYDKDHNLLQLDNFLDGVLAQNNLLKVTDGGGSQNHNHNPGATIIPGSEKGNSAIVAEIDQQIVEFSKS